MIPWYVGLILFFAGDLVGILAMAICVGSYDEAGERRRNKKNRQCGNTDGSVERSSRE